jgi:hypothetical protein
MTIIAANPGWCFVEPIWKDDGNKIDYIHFEPIIAWNIEDNGSYANPITIEGDRSPLVETIILQRPDGTITEIEGMVKMSIQDVYNRFMGIEKIASHG